MPDKILISADPAHWLDEPLVTYADLLLLTCRRAAHTMASRVRQAFPAHEVEVIDGAPELGTTPAVAIFVAGQRDAVFAQSAWQVGYALPRVLGTIPVPEPPPETDDD